jgi:hypothetical protein
VQIVYFLDDRRLGSGPREIELEAGEHELRIRKDLHLIDVRRSVRVAEGVTTPFEPELPEITSLVVQAFPSVARVFLRKPGGTWSFLDETPIERKLAVGRYEVKVDFADGSPSAVRTVRLAPGANPPLRFAPGSRG